MKKKVTLMWIVTGICAVLAVVFWLVANKVEVAYEEVTVTVVDTETKEIVNKKTNSRTTLYEVKVRYDGEEYNLENVHGLAGYYEGNEVKALLANGKLYANVEGIKSTTPVSIIYFVFLFGTFGMLMLSATYSSRWQAQKKANKTKESSSEKEVKPAAKTTTEK